MRYLVAAMLMTVGIIHLLPLSGVSGRAQLGTLYGVMFGDANLSILMRHCAVLFGMLGAFFVLAAFQPQYQLVALIAGFISVVSFLWLAWSVGGYNAQIARVFAADGVALVCLIVGTFAYIYQRSQG